MNYYLLPKVYIDNKIIITTLLGSDIKVYNSYSLFNYYNKVIQYLNKLCESNNDNSFNLNYYINIINLYQYIYNIILNDTLDNDISINYNLFYDLLEIYNLFDLRHKISLCNNIFIISENYINMKKFVYFIKKDIEENKILYFNNFNFNYLSYVRNTFDFIFIDFIVDSNIKNYIVNLINSLLRILYFQNKNGLCVLKIDHLFFKPSIDILYILSFLYDNVSIIKPMSSNVLTFEKYIICKNFHVENNSIFLLENKLINLLKKIDMSSNEQVIKIINYELPSYFMNKIEEINCIYGQQQLDNINQLIYLIKNKNKDEKIETIKKNNSQKSINWCEKYNILNTRIHYNKSNILL